MSLTCVEKKTILQFCGKWAICALISHAVLPTTAECPTLASNTACPLSPPCHQHTPIHSISARPASTDGRLLRLLRAILASCVGPVRNAAQIECATHQFVPHTGTILGAPAAHEHDAVLLDVVALSRNVRGDGFARRQTHTRRLTLARVGLLGPRNADFDAHAFALRIFAASQGGRDGVTGSSFFTASLRNGRRAC